MHSFIIQFVVSSTLLLSSNSFAQSLTQQPYPKGMPVCQGYNGLQLTRLDNDFVMNLKKTTKNLYKKQVFVKAKLVSIGQVANNSYGKHLRFVVTLAKPGEDIAHENLIEISHSMNGYTSPTASDLSAGPIYICGEYSTTDVNKEPKITKFEPSTTGAMIHWTHLATPDVNSTPSGHPNGWIFANGKLFGTYKQ